MQFDPKFQTLSRNVTYFAGFQQNNSVFTQNDHGFKKYQLQKKLIFWQLLTKFANFADIRRNNSIFTQLKKKSPEK